MLPPLAVLWFCDKGNFFVLSQFKSLKQIGCWFIEWLSQQTGTLEVGPAMSYQYCSALAKVCTMDQVWILHIFSGLSSG